MEENEGDITRTNGCHDDAGVIPVFDVLLGSGLQMLLDISPELANIIGPTRRSARLKAEEGRAVA